MEKTGEEKINDPEAIKEFAAPGTYGIVFHPSGLGSQLSRRIPIIRDGQRQKREELERLYAERQGRFHHRMMLEVRNATLDRLSENQLGLIQRRILATSNDILGADDPILLGVGFNDYQLIEE
ncbi:MAG: hypothetical protein R3C56_05590 [Pirellulaceae bacterium]